MNEISLSNTTAISALLHGGTDFSAPMTKDIFLTKQSIVGTRYLGDAEDLVKELEPGSRVTLLHETDNRFDERAVIVIDEEGRKLGYIPRHQNAVISALLDAGKMFYGIVAEQPERTRDRDVNAPYRFMIDLYMREFTGPEDPAFIPRYGHRGSCAVIALKLTEGEKEQSGSAEPSDSSESPGSAEQSGSAEYISGQQNTGQKSGAARRITGVCALKIINGEERGIYCCELDENADRAAQSRMLAEFEEAVGYLPLVSYGLAGCRLEALEDAYGVFLGKSFSNHVIDTKKMIGIHIPERSFRTLEECAIWLGITCEAETELERECRLIWNLYCRLDRSELEHKSK